MRDFNPNDDAVFPEGYSPQETLDDISPEIPNQYLILFYDLVLLKK